jgi:hypothetical protein
MIAGSSCRRIAAGAGRVATIAAVFTAAPAARATTARPRKLRRLVAIQVMMKYRNTQGETGTIALTYWTPMSGQEVPLPPDRQESIAQMNQQLRDMICRGIP